MCNCAYLLVRMFRTKQLTNFVVAHAIWIETIGLVSIVSLNVVYIVDSFSFIFVILTQFYNFVWAATGISVLIARLVDPDFRASFVKLICRRGNATKEWGARPPSQLLRVPSSLIDDTAFSEVFRSLHIKVNCTQFILDSLISLTLSLRRETLRAVKGVVM